MKLNQVVAQERKLKPETYSFLSEQHKLLQKPEPFKGLSRTYQKKTEDGDDLPAESTRVQVKAHEVLKDVQTRLARYFDVALMRDAANCSAFANVVVDGQVLLEKVPVTYLMFLDKQLSDLKTFVEKLPVLDASEEWSFDANKDCWVTLPTETYRTKKVLKALVKYPATVEHPAQTETYSEDVVVGQWRVVKFSGALPAARVRSMLDRVQQLHRAVGVALEEANMLDAEKKEGASRKLLEFIFNVG